MSCCNQGWRPPDPKTLSCCVLQNYRPLPAAYCCEGYMTDLELKNLEFQTFKKYDPYYSGRIKPCCFGRRRKIW